MNKDGLISIKWSDKCVRQWFGLCQKWEDDLGHAAYAIQVNRILSSPDIDREVVKYLVYHEMLHKSGYWEHDMKFRELEWAYPNSDECDGCLDELSLRYKMDLVWKNPRRKPTDSKENVEQNSSNENIIYTTSQDTPSKNKFCRNCGNKLPVKANFCDKCGSKTDYQ